MSRERQLLIWLALFAVFIALLFLLRQILLPFVAGMAIAYFLDPIADKLEEWGTSRTVATIIITVVFFAVVIAGLILLVPVLQSQVLGFFRNIPKLIELVTGLLGPVEAAIRERVPAEQLQEISAFSRSLSGSAVQWLFGLLKGIWQGGLAVFNVISLIIITPVVSFYLIRDWNKIVRKIDGWLPRSFAPTIRRLISEIDESLSGFLRGQLTVGIILAVIYGAGLTLIGLDFGLLVGVTTGLISFVPYFGMLIGMATGVAIAIVQFGEILPVVMVLAVFGVGQLIESIFLTPKLVGDKVGLHAVWVIFALMAGGALFGFTGILLAVPVAASIGVLVRFSITEYLESDLYGGGPGNDGGSRSASSQSD